MPRRFLRTLTPHTTGAERRAALACALALVACDGTPHAEATGRDRPAVVYGEPSPPGQEDGVLALHTVVDGSELVCSASLVAPNLVMTARHCVSYLTRGIFSCTVRGELVSMDPGAGTLGGHLPAGELEFYGGTPPRAEALARGSVVLSTLSETICLNDIAFVVLDRSLELPVLPLRLAGRARRGEAVTLVGYGLDETADESDKLDLVTQPRLRNDELSVAEVGPVSSDDLITIAPPRTVVVEGPSGCFGDSGGPLLASETSAVLGVYSLLAGSSCTGIEGRHLFIHVPDFPGLTRDAFERAGHEPVPEPAAPSIGAAGEGGNANEAGAAGEGGKPAGSSGAGEEAGAAGSPGPTTGSSGATNEGGAAGLAETPAESPPPSTPRRRDEGCSTSARRAGRFGLELYALLAAASLFAVRRRRRRAWSAPLF